MLVCTLVMSLLVSVHTEGDSTPVFMSVVVVASCTRPGWPESLHLHLHDNQACPINSVMIALVVLSVSGLADPK